MQINIYYGGRGIIDDPTLYVISRMTSVFRELNVEVTQFNLFEQKNSITALAATIKGADGIVLASTVEWFGVGGFMTQFLDACWLYGDKEKLSTLYMLPVVMSTTYGERDGMTFLAGAWEILGGLPCDGLCGYIAETSTLEHDSRYNDLIEKKAENFYRTINQKLPGLPNSNQAVKHRISMSKGLDLTPQESEQLSQYAADDKYVQTQKEDIQELVGLFRSRMGRDPANDDLEEYLEILRTHFKPEEVVHAQYKISIADKPAMPPIQMDISGEKCICAPSTEEAPCDVWMQMGSEVMDNILGGRMTFQRAFMSGSMRMKGEFKLLRSLDQIFRFKEKEA